MAERIEAGRRIDDAITWIKGRERSILIGAVGFQFLVLVSMIVLRLTPHLVGETILLRVEPVDPRDLFRGDYVILSYPFSRGANGAIPGFPLIDRQDRREWAGRTVFVVLVPEPDGRHWKADRYSDERPRSGKYLRGVVADSGALEFGIESFFVQEGEGRKYEDAVRNRKLSAEISLTSDGTAALRRLVVE